MKEIEEETPAITEEDFKEFLSAETYEEQFRILLAHAEKNRKVIKIRRMKNMENNNVNDEVTSEEIGNQFEEFCKTKGIKAKFRLAFHNIAESARAQREADKAHFEEVKKQSAEANPEFTEFLQTKGFKAKVKLIIENIKKGAKESNEKVKKQIEQSKHAHTPHTTAADYTAEQLTAEFNAFLKEKGLDDKYVVEVTEE